MSKKQPKTKDIFNGKLLTIWEDKDFVWISFPFVTINIPKEEYENFKEDVAKLADL